MSTFEDKQIKSKELKHLGLVAGTIKKIRLIEKIDKLLPVSKQKGAHVTMGERVAAMLLNALGFVDSRLYMFSEFLANKPVNRLLGSHLKAEHFTDDALARCLDAIYEYGPTRFFSNIAFSMAHQLSLLARNVHLDTTTLSVYGAYDGQTGHKQQGPKITYGFAKNKRLDLKQLVLSLATVGQADLPIFMAALSGNAPDQKTLIRSAEQLEQFRQELASAPSFNYVADSAMYESCLKAAELTWISRVPAQRKEAKRFIQGGENYDWQSVAGTDYKVYAKEKVIAEVRQRWVLVFSQQAYKRDAKILEKQKAKEWTVASKKLQQLSKQKYGCKKDAEKALSAFQKELKYHKITTVLLVPKKQYESRGRPLKGERAIATWYQLKGELIEDSEKIRKRKAVQGRFLLATNQLDKNALSDEEILFTYRDQQKTERGFAFIKDNTFEVSSIFLKKPSRISALMSIMVLSLFIYSLIQHLIRQSLKEKEEYLPNQLKKQVQNPTAKWIFFLFKNVQIVYIRGPGDDSQELVINLNEVLKRIISYLGIETMAIYDTVVH